MVVTAQSTAGLEPQARSHGAELFLQKPIQKKAFMEILQRVFEQGPPEQT